MTGFTTSAAEMIDALMAGTQVHAIINLPSGMSVDMVGLSTRAWMDHDPEDRLVLLVAVYTYPKPRDWDERGIRTDDVGYVTVPDSHFDHVEVTDHGTAWRLEYEWKGAGVILCVQRPEARS
jgi:hypothetical protein